MELKSVNNNIILNGQLRLQTAIIKLYVLDLKMKYYNKIVESDLNC